MEHQSQTIANCRSCDSTDLRTFLDLGRMPLADRLVGEADLGRPEPRFPLEVAFCGDCSLVQITETVDPEVLFSKDYPYYSSFSPALLAHARDNTIEQIAHYKLDAGSLVIEVASNDGYLLKNYFEKGIPVLGIDPADGPAEAAGRVGVSTRRAFFTRELAEELRAAGQAADVIHANNVLAHVADTNGIVAGFKTLLKRDGVAVIEVPYLKTLIDEIEFDTIYHEHLCYFSVTALDRLFRRHGLFLNRLRHFDLHGGSLRLYLEHHDRRDECVDRQLALEAEAGLDRFDYFQDFSNRVRGLKEALLQLLADQKAAGMKIAAYGAAAKGATLTNYLGIGREIVDFVVDRNTHKHNHFMPGCGIPILPTEALVERKPDLVLLLAWNFAKEILAQQKAYRAAGGRFLIPIPKPVIV